MNLEVKIEIKSIVKKISSQQKNGNTHNFVVFVQGTNSNHIEHFVKQVVFHLPFNSSNSIQVKQNPPFRISGSAHSSFRLPIDIFLQTSEARNKVRYSYYVYLPDKPEEKAVNVKTLTFLNTPQDFRERLLRGGAEVVNEENHEIIGTQVKNEPVEIKENLNESPGNEASDEFAIVAVKVAADSGKNISKKNDEHLKCKTESPDILNETLIELTNPPVQIEDISEQNDSFLIEGVYSFDELLKENENLKTENAALLNKFNQQERENAALVKKTSLLQKDLSVVDMEFDQLKEKDIANETELLDLKSTIQMLLSGMHQHKNQIEGRIRRQRKPAVSKATLQHEESEPHSFTGHLNPTERDSVVCEDKSLEKDSFQLTCEYVSESVPQKCMKRKQQDSFLERKSVEQAISTTDRTNVAMYSSGKMLTQYVRQENKEVELQKSLSIQNKLPDLNSEKNDLVLPDSTISRVSFLKELSNNVLEEPDQAYVEGNLLQIIEDEEYENSSHKAEGLASHVLKTHLCENVTKDTASKCRNDEVRIITSNQKDSQFAVSMPSNCASISIENNSLQKESTKYLTNKEIQENFKGGLQGNLNPQKRDPEVSGSTHLKSPSVNMKRAIFLPIPESSKKFYGASQNVNSVKQKNMSSVPCATLLNNSASLKHLTGDEQACSTVKGLLHSSKNETSPVPVQNKNSAPANKSTLNSVDAAKTNKNQPDSACIRASAQFQKRARKHEREPKSSNPIGSILKDVDDRLICEAKQNFYTRMLTEFFLNSGNCLHISDFIFCVIDHLLQTTKNYLEAFKEDQSNCIFLPSSESCIVSMLFEMEKKLKTYSQLNLIKNTLETIHHLVIGAKKVFVYGFASLCRVFTEICKRKCDLKRPLALCVEIMKQKLRFAPYLIASIVGVWREPFMLTNDQSEEAMILLGSVSLGARKKTKSMDDSNWLCSAVLISEYFGFPSLPDVNVAINFLKDKIISNCVRNSHEKSWMVTSSFVILASLQPWEWTETYLFVGYIVPNLYRFANTEPNPDAFALFCDLCVDVYKVCTGACLRHQALMKYFNQVPKGGNSFVRDSAAVSMIKYLISTRNKIRPELSEWMSRNYKKHCIKEFKEFYLRRRMYYEKFKKDLVVIT